MARRIESLFLAGQNGRLEALLEEPEHNDPVEAAVVCHPHPQFGGTMHNKVVYRLARGLRRSGCVVLRFNYRGVNLSEGSYDDGVGETDDARVALEELARRYPGLPYMGAGFSFGSRVILRLAASEPAIQRIIAAGYPTRIAEREVASQVIIPKFFVQSTADEFGPRHELDAFFAELPEPKHLDWIPATDHFFKDGLDPLEQVIERIGRQRSA